MIEHVRISIRVAVSYVDHIVIIYKLDLEAQCVRRLLISRYLLDLLLRHEILYVVAASVPSVACRLHILFRVDQWFHSLAVRRIRFA